MKTDYGVYILSEKEKIRFLISAYISLAFLGYIFYKSIIVSMICGFACFFLIPMYKEHLCRKRKDMLTMQFKDFLYSLSASVSTGRNMTESIKDAYVNLKGIYQEESPILNELAIIVSGLENRESEAVLLRDFAKRSRSRDISGFTDVYLSVRESGGDLERAIERTCEIIMDKITIERDISVMINQKKLEARIITVIPIVIVAALNFTSSGYIAPLYQGVAGRAIMTGCLGIIGGAYYLTEKITDLKI